LYVGRADYSPLTFEFVWSSSPVAQGRILNFRQRALQQRLGGSIPPGVLAIADEVIE
jgi:hypothetical protein